MTQLLQENVTSKTLSGLAFLWGFLVCCSSLNASVLPQVHWYAAPVLLSPLIIRSLKNGDLAGVLPALGAPAVLVVAFLLASFSSDTPVLSLVHSTKVAVLLLVIYTLFLLSPRFARAAFYGAIAAVSLNALLVLLQKLSLLDWARLGSHGRWDTVLANRTTLSLLGCFVFVYAACTSLVKSRTRVLRMVLLCCSIALVFWGGSRTYIVALPIGFAFAVVAAWWSTSDMPLARRLVPLLLSGTLIAGLAFAGRLLSGEDSESWVVLPERVSALLEFDEQDSVGEYLETQDPARYSLMLEALDRVRQNPFMGAGFHSLYSAGGREAPIHNSYLQAWADLGLLGFLSYCALTLGWMLHLRSAVNNLSLLHSIEDRAVYSTAIWGLCLFVFVGLRSPIAVEQGPWFYFLIPSALYWQLLRGGRLEPSPLLAPHARHT